MTVRAETELSLVRVDDGQPGQGGKSAYEYAQDAGYSGTEAQFSNDLSEVPNKADQDDLDDVAVMAEVTQQSVSSLIANIIATINLAAGTINADKIDVDTLTTQQAFITAIETSLIDAGAITTAQLDAGTISANVINAINLATSTINVSRIIYTDPDTGESYFVEIDPTTKSPTYEKVDGSVIEDLTISADKIQAGAISTDKLNIGAYMQFGYVNDDPSKPRITIGNTNSFAVVIDPTQISFIYANEEVAYMNNEILVIPQSAMLREMHVGHDDVSGKDLWSWTEHDNNLCLKWIGGNV